MPKDPIPDLPKREEPTRVPNPPVVPRPQEPPTRPSPDTPTRPQPGSPEIG